MDRRRRINPYDPFDIFRAFNDDSFFPRRAFRAAHSLNVDQFETEKEVVVTAELPGVDKHSLKLKVNADGLGIHVEHKEKKEEEKNEGGVHARSYVERFEGQSEFVPFHSEVIAEKAKATFKNGVLEVRIPKKNASKGRELKVD